jgi:hypothetical protein
LIFVVAAATLQLIGSKDMTREEILQRVQRFQLDRRIAGLSGGGWNAVSTSAPRAHLAGRLQMLERIAESFSGPEAAVDLTEAVAYWYISLRADWALANLEVQSCLVQGRPLDLRLALIGGIEAQMLAEFASLLRPEDIDRIEDGLFEAMNRIGISPRERREGSA